MLEWALGADPVLPIFVAADKVGVDVIGAFLIFDFREKNPCLIVTFDVGIAVLRSENTIQMKYVFYI